MGGSHLPYVSETYGEWNSPVRFWQHPTDTVASASL